MVKMEPEHYLVSPSIAKKLKDSVKAILITNELILKQIATNYK